MFEIDKLIFFVNPYSAHNISIYSGMSEYTSLKKIFEQIRTLSMTLIFNKNRKTGIIALYN